MVAMLGGNNEQPQETHFWNCIALSARDRTQFTPDVLESLVTDTGDYTTTVGDRMRAQISRVWPLFHCWILGGLNQYVVLETRDSTPWFVGWITPDTSWGGVSIIPIFDRKVRCLVRPTPMCFFALNGSGTSMPIHVAGKGRIGDKEYAHVRLR